ncbi:PIN domain-containing protein [Desulfofundulus thermosubterraneus]|uniref:Predicted nucleic acid-binding protein, contains PIN domain n=1 Tax=Desulfofundulus thermosubterraneus DSM 16057 TaxID=1121432 RepID=A0A1M6K1T7_9FIRM|nr:PIN domain-containing protein [Desulfofundulus thermosubterraneus]SHJ52913.1 Predicted nucleic acid-binding protein, contains PIN domain [Desulfofundulus thermosubterraneus DSM 16057]
MSAKVLVDTNILVYAYDSANPRKQQISLEILDRLAFSRTGALTVQVLAEFVVAVTRKIAEPLDFDAVQKSVEHYLRSWIVFDLTGMIVLEAVRGVREHKFSYWDAQIWAAARLNQLSLVLSEDFSSGTTIEGVTFVNPFVPGWQVNELP